MMVPMLAPFAVSPGVRVPYLQRRGQATHHAENRLLEPVVGLCLVTVQQKQAPCQPHELDVSALEGPITLEAQGNQPGLKRSAEPYQCDTAWRRGRAKRHGLEASALSDLRFAKQ